MASNSPAGPNAPATVSGQLLANWAESDALPLNDCTVQTVREAVLSIEAQAAEITVTGLLDAMPDHMRQAILAKVLPATLQQITIATGLRRLIDGLRQPNGTHTYTSGIHASNCGACWLLHELHALVGDEKPCPACGVANLDQWNGRQSRTYCSCCPECESFQ